MVMRAFLVSIVSVLSFVFTATPPAYGAKHHSDQQIRTVVRKKAPFWIHQGPRQFRINKDGTISLEGARKAREIVGKWKVEKGLLQLTFKDGKEEVSLPVEIQTKPTDAPLIGGVPLTDGKYLLQ